VNTNEQTMAWIMDTYSMHMRADRHRGRNRQADQHRRVAGTSRGYGARRSHGLREAIQKLRLNRETTRVIVQGFGNVGSNAARLMAEAGYKVIGIIEVGGGLYNRNGIDAEALWEFRQKQWHDSRLSRARRAYDPAELLLADCDILIPAATENQITSRNAERVKCRILAEGANGPTTSAADDILSEKKVFVIPDILANAGGVTTSYFEWVQDRQGYFWKESVVNEHLEEIMNAAFDDVVGTRKRTGEQSHRRLHAGDRPRGVYHPPAWHLRLARSKIENYGETGASPVHHESRKD
jgi:glutamate dehydrogenase (NAD(P)+)